MKLHAKKKVEIVVEAVRLPQILEMVEAAGARGFTVIPGVSGKGNRGLRGDSHLSDVFRNVMVIVIAAEPVASRIVDDAQGLLEDYAGIVYISDVQVVREEHF